jgi:hypothetical protein
VHFLSPIKHLDGTGAAKAAEISRRGGSDPTVFSPAGRHALLLSIHRKLSVIERARSWRGGQIRLLFLI